MKVILLAAGQGSRLRPLTADRPKCMVAYRDKPILHYLLETISAVGLTYTVAVTGYAAEKLDRTFTKTFHNDNYQHSNMVASLFCAESELDDDVIISYTDIIYRPAVLKALIESPHNFSVVVDRRWEELWQARMSNPLSDAESLKITDGKITEIGKKPKSRKDIEGQYIGLIKIDAQALPQVVRHYHKLRADSRDEHNFNNMFMTDFIQSIIDQVMPVYPVWIDGGWLEIDSINDLSCDILG